VKSIAVTHSPNFSFRNCAEWRVFQMSKGKMN
jgi:hypothetical protein